MDEDKIKSIAKEAAKEAIEELFIVLGVDLTDKDRLLELQKDFMYNRDARLGKEEFIKKSKLTLIGIFIAGLAGLILKGLGVNLGH